MKPNFYILFLLLPLMACGQARQSARTGHELEKIYTKAIGDFIKAANLKQTKAFDTLFIANRRNGQADDFPDISLPPRIEQTEIVLLSSDKATQSQKERNTRIYINLMGWVEQEKASFIFVVFSNGFEHQYDCNISYKLGHSGIILENMAFKMPPF